MFNPLSCSGWESTATGWVTTGACMKARLGLVILFFVIALLRKWGGEEIGMAFSFIMSLVGGLGSYLMIIFITGSFKIAMVIGLIAAILFGYGFGIVFGDEGGGD